MPVKKVRIRDDEAGQRIDRWLKTRFPSIGFGQLQKLLRRGEIRIDGKRVRPDARLPAGAEVRLPPMLATLDDTNQEDALRIPGWGPPLPHETGTAFQIPACWTSTLQPLCIAKTPAWRNGCIFDTQAPDMPQFLVHGSCGCARLRAPGKLHQYFRKGKSKGLCVQGERGNVSGSKEEYPIRL